MAQDPRHHGWSERKAERAALISRPLAFSLEPMPPFRLDLTAWALRRRPDNAVDRWDGRTYRRTAAMAGEPVEIAVTQVGPPEEPRLRWSPYQGLVYFHLLLDRLTGAGLLP